MWARIIALTYKEILSVVRDRRGRMVLIVPPLLQLFIFAFAATLEVNNIAVAVLDQDRNTLSRELLQRLSGSPTFERLLYTDNLSTLQEHIDTQRAMIALQIPQNFTADIIAGRGASLQVILDGRRSNAAQIAQGYIGTIVTSLNTEIVLQRQVYAANPADKLSNVETVVRHWFNPNLIYRWFTVPGLIGIITLLIGLAVTSLSVARERELGTFDQLLVSPLRPAEILVGKTLPSLSIGLVHGTVFFLVSIFFFKIPFTGSLPVFYASMILFILSVIGVGLFISSISKTQQQAFLFAFVFVAPAILLSGFAAPVENMPEWLQTINMVNPIQYFLVIIHGLFAKAMPFDAVMENLLPLFFIAVATLVSATIFFRRRME